jgi:hypothetical protein
MNHWILDVKSVGRVITREISRDRITRRVSLPGRRVAMYAPSGLGNECVEAVSLK